MAAKAEGVSAGSGEMMDMGEVSSGRRLLHSPSSYARKHLCYVQEVGQLRSLRPHTSRREGLESYLYLYVRSGSGELCCNGQSYALKAGDAALIDCRESYEHSSCADDPWELEWVHYDGAKAEAFYALYQKAAGSPVFRRGQELRESALIGELMAAQELGEPIGELKSDLLLSELMLHCIEAVSGRTQSADYERIREYLNQAAGEIGGDEALAARMEAEFQQDYARLDEGFVQRYGISIQGYLENRQLNKAKELLRFTIKPLDEVIAESGIGDEARLRALFLTYEEMDPEEYRRKWAQWIKG